MAKTFQMPRQSRQDAHGARRWLSVVSGQAPGFLRPVRARARALLCRFSASCGGACSILRLLCPGGRVFGSVCDSRNWRGMNLLHASRARGPKFKRIRPCKLILDSPNGLCYIYFYVGRSRCNGGLSNGKRQIHFLPESFNGSSRRKRFGVGSAAGGGEPLPEWGTLAACPGDCRSGERKAK